MWVIAKMLLHLSTALILGGGIALGALTAPVVFRRHERSVAGQTMTEIFRRFDKVLWVCVLVILLSELMLFRSFEQGGLSWLRLLASASLVILGGYHAKTLGPEIARRVDAGATNGEEFTVLHKRSETIFKTITVLGALSLSLLALGY